MGHTRLPWHLTRLVLTDCRRPAFSPGTRLFYSMRLVGVPLVPLVYNVTSS